MLIGLADRGDGATDVVEIDIDNQNRKRNPVTATGLPAEREALKVRQREKRDMVTSKR